ncbi:unnamed protein product [Symbiodinium microadriaticum]|nr:unnamed protein product [Symbiodinium microadriaticum]
MSASKLEKNIANLERRMREEFKAELAQGLKVQSIRLDAFEAQLQRLQPRPALLQDVNQDEESNKGRAQGEPEQSDLVPVVPVVREAWAEDAEAQEVAVTSAETDPMEPVAFLETSWNLVLVLGYTGAGWCDVVIACLLFLASVATQAFFSWILLSPEFQGDPFSLQIEIATAWRRSVAHDSMHVDLAQTSLISRVCNDDGALILSTDQASLIRQINSFLGYQKSTDFDQEDASRTGVLLAMLCILLWCLYISNEFRTIWLSLEAVAQLPLKRRTDFHDGRFKAMSWPRFCAYFLLRLLRAAISGALLYAGILWLGATTSISDLIVNAVALGAVLSVDEMVFAALMPKKLQIKIQDLEAIKIRYSRCRSQVEAVCIMLALGGVLAWSYVYIVNPLAQDMETVKRAYCFGNQDFVVGMNEDIQLVFGIRTIPHANVSGRTLSQLAVENYIYQEPSMPADYISFQSDVQRFDRMVLQTMEESATGFAYCKDLDTLYILDQPDEEIVNEFVDLYRPYFWSAAAVLNEPRNSTCLDMVSHCNDAEARMLRQVCGVTCGCADPRSYPVYKVPHKGCSRNCLSNAASPEQPICEDIENGAMWKQFWDGYPTVLSSEIGVMLDYNSTLGQWVLQLIGAMQEFGCAALAFHPELAKEPVTQQRWCDGIAVRELTPAQVRRLLHVFSDGLVDIVSKLGKPASTPTRKCAMKEWVLEFQELPTGPHSSFRDALAARGYEGALFLGPGQEKVGVGLFWQRERASMVDTFPKDQVVPCGMETGSYGNVDLKEAGLRDMDRRLAGFVKLTVDELPTLLCGTHLMTGSRDKEGKIRQQELVTIADLMKAWADPGAGVILCGDFNVNSRGFLEEHIWEGTGYVRDSDTKANRFCWQRSGASPLILRDAFDSCYGDEACSSTRTGTRLETIDYIFFDEEAYTLLDSSKLRCPEQPMPNAEEPSDHIPVCGIAADPVQNVSQLSLAAVVVSACVRRGEVAAVGGWSTSLRVKQAPLRFLLAPLRLQHTLSAVQDVAAVLEVGAGGPERQGQTEDAFQPEPATSKEEKALKVHSSRSSVSVMFLELDLDVAAPVLHWEEHLEEAFILRFGRVRLRTVENNREPELRVPEPAEFPVAAMGCAMAAPAAWCLFEDAGIVLGHGDVLTFGKVALQLQRSTEGHYELAAGIGGIEGSLHTELSRRVAKLSEALQALVTEALEDRAAIEALRRLREASQPRRSRFYSAWEKFEMLGPMQEKSANRSGGDVEEEDTGAVLSPMTEEAFSGYGVNAPCAPAFVSTVLHLQSASLRIFEQRPRGTQSHAVAHASLEGVHFRVQLFRERAAASLLFTSLQLQAASLTLQSRRLLTPRATGGVLLDSSALVPLRAEGCEPLFGVKLQQLAVLYRQRDSDALLQLLRSVLRPLQAAEGAGSSQRPSVSSLDQQQVAETFGLEAKWKCPLFRCWIGAPKVFLPTDPTLRRRRSLGEARCGHLEEQNGVVDFKAMPGEEFIVIDFGHVNLQRTTQSLETLDLKLCEVDLRMAGKTGKLTSVLQLPETKASKGATPTTIRVDATLRQGREGTRFEASLQPSGGEQLQIVLGRSDLTRILDVLAENRSYASFVEEATEVDDSAQEESEASSFVSARETHSARTRSLEAVPSPAPVQASVRARTLATLRSASQLPDLQPKKWPSGETSQDSAGQPFTLQWSNPAVLLIRVQFTESAPVAALALQGSCIFAKLDPDLQLEVSCRSVDIEDLRLRSQNADKSVLCGSSFVLAWRSEAGQRSALSIRLNRATLQVLPMLFADLATWGISAWRLCAWAQCPCEPEQRLPWDASELRPLGVASLLIEVELQSASFRLPTAWAAQQDYFEFCGSPRENGAVFSASLLSCEAGLELTRIALESCKVQRCDAQVPSAVLCSDFGLSAAGRTWNLAPRRSGLILRPVALQPFDLRISTQDIGALLAAASSLARAEAPSAEPIEELLLRDPHAPTAPSSWCLELDGMVGRGEGSRTKQVIDLQILDDRQPGKLLDVRIGLPSIHTEIRTATGQASSLLLRTQMLELEVESYNRNLRVMEPVVLPIRLDAEYEVLQGTSSFRVSSREKLHLVITPIFIRLVMQLQDELAADVPTAQRQSAYLPLITGLNLTGTACEVAAGCTCIKLPAAKEVPLDALLYEDSAELRSSEGDPALPLRLARVQGIKSCAKVVPVPRSYSRLSDHAPENGEVMEVPQPLPVDASCLGFPEGAGAKPGDGDGDCLAARQAVSLPQSALAGSPSGSMPLALLQVRPASPAGALPAETFTWSEPVPVFFRRHPEPVVPGRRRSTRSSVTSTESGQGDGDLFRRCQNASGSCPLRFRVVEEGGRQTLCAEPPLRLRNSCPVPLLLTFEPELHREELETVPAGAVRVGALAKIFDGLGGFLAVVIAAAGDAADAELGGGGVELCPVRADSNGFLWWELDGSLRHIVLPQGTNAVELRRTEAGVGFRCLRAAALPGRGCQVLQLGPREPLPIFELPMAPTRLSVALIGLGNERSEWSLPLRLPSLMQQGELPVQRWSSSSFEVRSCHLPAEEVLEVRWARAIFPLIARRSAPETEVVIGARRWFVNSTTLPIQLTLPDGSALPHLTAGATLLAHPLHEADAAEAQSCLQRVCGLRGSDPDLSSTISLAFGRDCVNVQLPGAGGFEDVFFPSGEDCVLREEGIALAMTFGLDCSLVSLVPALVVFNCSPQQVGFLWNGQAPAQAEWLNAGQRKALRVPMELSEESSRSLLLPVARDAAPERPKLQVLVNTQHNELLISPPFAVDRAAAGCSAAMSLPSSARPELCRVAVDEAFGAVAVSVAGRECCHRLTCEEGLEAYVDTAPADVARSGGSIYFGVAEPFESSPSVVLVLQRPGPGIARVDVGLSRNNTQAIPATSSLGVPARVDVSVKEHVATVFVSLGHGRVDEEAAQSETLHELQLGGLTLSLAEAPGLQEGLLMGYSPETISVALDGFQVRLRRFANDSEEFKIRIDAVQVDLRPKKARDPQPLVLLASIPRRRALPFLRWSSLRRACSDPAEWRFGLCRLDLGPAEVTVTEAVWQEVGRFLDQAASGPRGLGPQEVAARVGKELPAVPPTSGQRLQVEQFSVEAVSLKVWCSLYLPEATFLPAAFRAAVEFLGLGTETLVVEGAKVRVAAQPWLVGRGGRHLVGSVSSVLDSLSRAYLPQVRRSIFSLVANSNAALGGLLGLRCWRRLFGCARRQTVRSVRPELCALGADGAVRAADGRGAEGSWLSQVDGSIAANPPETTCGRFVGCLRRCCRRRG